MSWFYQQKHYFRLKTREFREKFNEMWLYYAFLLDNIAKSRVGAIF